MESGGFNISLLAELINPGSNDAEIEEQISQRENKVQAMGPGDIYAPKPKSSQSKEPGKDETGKTIWREGEVKLEEHLVDTLDPRTVPEYKMIYSQDVDPETMFLGLGMKTASTSSCEHLVVTIKLPNATLSELDLNLTKTRLELRSPTYFLGLPLPHEIHPEEGNAKWDQDTETLKVVLKLDRELDPVNF